MNQYTQGIMTILSLVNPVICGLLFSQAVSGKPRAEQIMAATRATLAILVIWMQGVMNLLGRMSIKKYCYV